MKFLVIGDAMVDTYWRGNIHRLNPEKHAAPLVLVNNTASYAGGAANVAENLRAMGIETTLVSGKGSIVKHRVIDEQGVVCRFDVEDTLLPIEEVPDVDADAVVVSDYGKGSIIPATVAGVRKKYNGKPIFVDTKMYPDEWGTVVTCFFPNQSEYDRHIRSYRFSRLVLVKKGERGAQFMRDGTRSEMFPSVAEKIVNVSGAGDTVLAAYAAGYCFLMKSEARSVAEQAAARFAMQMAAIAVSKPVTYAPTASDAKKYFPGSLYQMMGEVP